MGGIGKRRQESSTGGNGRHREEEGDRGFNRGQRLVGRWQILSVSRGPEPSMPFTYSSYTKYLIF